MTHLAASVKNWGPLWATSTFSFKSFNGTMLKYFNGTTHVPFQIMKRYLRGRSVTKKGATVMLNANENVKNWEMRTVFLWTTGQQVFNWHIKSVQISARVRVFGKSVHTDVSVLHMLAIETSLLLQPFHCEWNTVSLLHQQLPSEKKQLHCRVAEWNINQNSELGSFWGNSLCFGQGTFEVWKEAVQRRST